jgi:hypothetical protein
VPGGVLFGNWALSIFLGRTRRMNLSNRITAEGLLRTAAFMLLVFSLRGAPARAQSTVQEVFATAPIDVECTFIPSAEELSCDRFGARHLRLVLGPSGYGQMFTVLSDEACCSTETVLELGRTWSQGPLICQYALNGLSCEREGHGFHIGKNIVVAY